mmetsp:Transcript_13475/g.22410  ORF Transcript_13475/g.22410 Transcript_13475/m.22410 type:complete len:278 (-) Transcript_13475:166-999(-)
MLLLTPQISPLDESRWRPFIHNHELKSYSYYLPTHNKNGEVSGEENKEADDNVFTSEQLDDWFRLLHPSQYIDESKDHAWTATRYKCTTLLRQTAWFTLDSSCTCEYGYSDTWQPQIKSEKMSKVLRDITASVVEVVGGDFNSVNLNYYPQGGGVGAHADDEFLFDGLNRETRIVSLSLCGKSGGGARKFEVKRKGKKYSKDVKEILLQHGDLMTMEGFFQKYYLHSVWPGDSKLQLDHPLCQGERINLTWRTIVRHLDGSDECRGLTCTLSKTMQE